MVKRSRQKFTRRFNFALTEEMHNDLYAIAGAADADNPNGADAAEVVRRMIRRETPFFMAYVSRERHLPNGDTTPPTTDA